MTEDSKVNNKLRFIFPVLVLVLSLFTIFYYRSFERNYISLAVSIIGIVGVLFYFLKIKLFRLLFIVWIAVQFVMIYITPSADSFEFGIHPIFEAVQSIFLKYSFTVYTRELNVNEFLHIELNIMPILFFFLYNGTLSSDSNED